MLDNPHAAIATNASAAWPDEAAAPLAQREYLILVRQLARVQQHMTVLVNGYEAQLSQVQRQLMRQSVLLLLARTRVDWGLSSAMPDTQRFADAPVRDALVAAQTEALICKTGCVTDNHHWRDGDQCLRTGMACVVPVQASQLPRP